MAERSEDESGGGGPARNALVLALITLALVALSPLSFRLGLNAWGAFILLGLAFLSGFAAIRLALPSLVAAGDGLSARKGVAALALVIAAAPLVLPTAYGLRALASGGGALLIHDITTDTDDPPAFVALRALHRKGADYGGGKIAAAQRKAYPDIAPILSTKRPIAPSPAPSARRRGSAGTSSPRAPTRAASRPPTRRASTASRTTS